MSQDRWYVRKKEIESKMRKEMDDIMDKFIKNRKAQQRIRKAQSEQLCSTITTLLKAESTLRNNMEFLTTSNNTLEQECKAIQKRIAAIENVI